MDNAQRFQSIALLKKQYIFQGMDETQLDQVISHFSRADYPANEVVFMEGDVGNDFYIVFSGTVQVTQANNKGDREIARLTSGDYFGEEALLYDRPRSATITTIEPTVLLRLERPHFEELLQTFPDIRKNLSVTAESRHLARRIEMTWLDQDENICLICRRHEFFLVQNLVAPILVGVVSAPVLAYHFAAPTTFMADASLFVGVGILIFAALWGIWNWIDWGNDYFIVTDKRVVWMEKVIGLYTSRREAPLPTVLAVDIKRNYQGRLLDYGNVDVRTYTGSILMTNMAHPKLFEQFVLGYRDHARYQQKLSEAKEMQAALHKRLEDMTHPTISQNVSKPIPASPPPGKANRPSLRERLSTMFTVRIEKGGVITYRKHWLVLLGKVWLPTLTFIALFLLFLYLMWRSANHTPLFVSWQAWVVLFFPVFIGVFLWWLYQYVDWSNDIYQLTPDKILDIERKPLGSEDKKTAELDNILTIEHIRSGLLQVLFNYGSVIIKVGATSFTFFGVYNPDQVHHDVADYLEARRQKKQAEEKTRERERMVDWLATYYREAGPADNPPKSRPLL